MKKVISILCAVAMLFSLAACSNTATSGKDGITTVSWLLPKAVQTDSEMVEDAMAAITEPAVGARIDMQEIESSSFTERLQMKMAAGEAFDLCFSGWVNDYLKAVSMGGLLDITDLLKKNPDLKKAIPDYAWQAAEVNGKLYGVPNVQVYAAPYAMQILEDYVDEYNFDLSKVKTINDIEPFLEMIHKDHPNLYPFRTSYGTAPWTYPVWEEISSGISIRKDGSSPEVVWIKDTDEYKEAIAVMSDWYQKGYIRKDLLSAGDDTQDYSMGKYPVNIAGWAPGSEASNEAATGFNLTYAIFTEPYMSKSLALASMTAIGARSKNAEKAIEILELMNTNSDLINLATFGIEDVHYTKDAETGKIAVKENPTYKGSAWMYGNQFNSAILTTQDDTIWEDIQALNDSAIISPLIGFVLDTDPIKNEISQIAAVNKEYEDTAFIVQGMGKWDEYVAKLEVAGLSKVKDEIQRQVNEYWATK